MKLSINKITKAAIAAGSVTVAMMAAMTAACVSADNVLADERYELVWSDEFNGTGLNRNNWNVMTGNGGTNPGWGNNEMEYYKDSPNNISVSNGVLSIIARKEFTESDNEYYWNSAGKLTQTTKSFQYSSARITTSGKQSFQYGKIEARMKLPAVDGVWPAFWMMGYNDKGWPYCGEIDILESWNVDFMSQSAWHWFDDLHPEKNIGAMYTVKPISTRTLAMDQNGKFMNKRPWTNFDKTQWNTYGVIWDKDKMCFTVNDHIFWVQDISDSSMSEARAPYYFLLNMAVGGNLPGFNIDESKFPVTMQVDYVRVYQKKGTGSKADSVGGWADRNNTTRYSVTVKNGTKKLFSGKVYDGETLVIPEKLTKKGYLFKGFYNQSGVKITSDTRIRKSQTITAKWTKVKVPKASISKLKPKKKAITIKAVAKDAKGIQVKYSLKKSMAGAKNKTITGKTATITKLRSKKTYYVKARAYKLDSKKQKVWGKWSKVRKTTVK